MKQFDAIILGAGQAGPSLAGRLTAAGMTVALVERKLFGGTCVNTGCMPTKTLVASAYAALPADGALIVYDTIIDNDRRENAVGLLMSLNMLIETPAGFDYTVNDCEGWMRDAGFRSTYAERLAGPESMVVGRK